MSGLQFPQVGTVYFPLPTRAVDIGVFTTPDGRVMIETEETRRRSPARKYSEVEISPEAARKLGELLILAARWAEGGER